uniref:Uncharacterized protein n=1 Tax=Anopheles atroparvus TaxID=41427 RepID=A0A182J3B3_ANOAO
MNPSKDYICPTDGGPVLAKRSCRFVAAEDVTLGGHPIYTRWPSASVKPKDALKELRLVLVGSYVPISRLLPRLLAPAPFDPLPLAVVPRKLLPTSGRPVTSGGGTIGRDVLVSVPVFLGRAGITGGGGVDISMAE